MKYAITVAVAALIVSACSLPDVGKIRLADCAAGCTEELGACMVEADQCIDDLELCFDYVESCES